MQSSKILIVPDVHGRIFWRDVLDNTEDQIVFLGDYTDPYSFEMIFHEDAFAELQDIIQFKRDNPDRVILLLGNHDLFYIDKSFKSVRHTYSQYDLFHRLFMENFELFDLFHHDKGNNILFTHAGVTNGWLKEIQDIIDINSSIDQIFKEIADNHLHLLGQISYFRGGDYMWGSPLWADFEEHGRDTAYPDILQIVGHSLMDRPVITANICCLDCRKVFLFQDGEICEYSSGNR